VTHDQLEASTFADKIAVMYGGQIVQFGTPRDDCSSGRSPYGCRLISIGSPGMNLIEVQAEAGGVRFADTHLRLSEAVQQRLADTPYTTLQVGIRPEFIHVWDEHNPDALQADVTHIEDLGTYKILTLSLDAPP